MKFPLFHPQLLPNQDIDDILEDQVEPEGKGPSLGDLGLEFEVGSGRLGFLHPGEQWAGGKRGLGP